MASPTVPADPGSGNSPSRASVTIRSPSLGPSAPGTMTGARRDPFPPGFLALGEEVQVSAKPVLVAFLDPPALVLAAVSVLSLAAVAGTSDPGSAGVLFGVFLATYVTAMLLWARVVGRGLLVVLPLSFFLALVGVVAAELTNPSSTDLIRGAIPFETVLFAVLELVIPVVLALLTWMASHYAITSRRALELSGLLRPTARELALDQIQNVVPHPALWGGWVGYGTVNLFRPSAVGGSRWGIGHRSLRRQALGLSFYGVKDAPKLAADIQAALASVRRPSAATSAPTAAAPGAATAGSGALCAVCKTPLVFVAPSGRYYCPKCGTYA
jgi:hypothetical protein